MTQTRCAGFFVFACSCARDGAPAPPSRTSLPSCHGQCQMTTPLPACRRFFFSRRFTQSSRPPTCVRAPSAQTTADGERRLGEAPPAASTRPQPSPSGVICGLRDRPAHSAAFPLPSLRRCLASRPPRRHTADVYQGSILKYTFVGDGSQCPNACMAYENTPNGLPGIDALASVRVATPPHRPPARRPPLATAPPLLGASAPCPVAGGGSQPEIRL